MSLAALIPTLIATASAWTPTPAWLLVMAVVTFLLMLCGQVVLLLLRGIDNANHRTNAAQYEGISKQLSGIEKDLRERREEERSWRLEMERDVRQLRDQFHNLDKQLAQLFQERNA